MELDGQPVQEDGGNEVLLGDFGSMQIELYSMSQRLGIPELADLADYPTRFLNNTYHKKVLGSVRESL